jgi:hypothetical protein
MSSAPESRPPTEERGGPRLVTMYLLVALALAFAIGFALLIVFPFWSRSR